MTQELCPYTIDELRAARKNHDYEAEKRWREWRDRQRLQERKEAKLNYAKKYRMKNRDKIHQWHHTWYERNYIPHPRPKMTEEKRKKIARERCFKRYHENPSIYAESHHARYLKHREEILQKNRANYLKHQQKILAKAKDKYLQRKAQHVG